MYTQSTVMKEERDSAKNLVSGEFEKEFREGMVGKRRYGGKMPVVLGAGLGIAFVWLVILTVLREVEIARLRSDLDQLSANFIAVEASFKTLNEKIANAHLFDEFKSYDDPVKAYEDPETIYADEVEDGEVIHGKHKIHFDTEKLDGLTVLEDEDDADDDDEDYNDEESGDWYPDYDKRRDKIGKTNMVKLKPEDFSGSVVTLSKVKNANSIRELTRMINENPEIPDIDIAAAVPGKVSMSTESDERSKRSVLPDMVEEFAAPREMSRPYPKKYVPPTTTDKLKIAKLTAHTLRIARQSDDDMNERRPFIAAHFHGNTSHLSTSIHEHYKGNGLVRLAHGAHHDVWYPSPWTLASPHRPTLTQTGHVHVHHSGVYLVYVQIYYLDSHDVISWVLHRTNPELEGRETLLQCAQSTHSSEAKDKPNSCFSASALFLKRGDRLAVRNTGGGRHSLMQPEKSFIGLVQLADSIDPEREL